MAYDFKWIGAVNALWENVDNWTDDSGGEVATIPTAGSKVLVDCTLVIKPTTGPNSEVDLHTLDIIIPIDQGTLLTSGNGGKIHVTNTFSLTQVSGTAAGGSAWFASTAGNHPVLHSGCTGTVTLKPPSSNSNSCSLDVDAGATLTVKTLPRVNSTHTGVITFPVACLIRGIMIVANDAGIEDATSVSCTVHPGGNLQIRNTVITTHGFSTAAGGAVIDILADSVVMPPVNGWASGTIINVGSPTNTTSELVVTETSASPTSPIAPLAGDITINAYASVALSNFVATNRTITINMMSPDAVVVQSDIVGGTIALAGVYATGMSGTMAA